MPTTTKATNAAAALAQNVLCGDVNMIGSLSFGCGGILSYAGQLNLSEASSGSTSRLIILRRKTTTATPPATAMKCLCMWHPFQLPAWGRAGAEGKKIVLAEMYTLVVSFFPETTYPLGLLLC